MTADGELYIDETCRDMFDDVLNRTFGKKKWRLDGSKFSNFWFMEDFPATVNVSILNNKSKQIGIATITSKPEITENVFGERHINMTPKDIKISKKVKK